MLRIRPTRRSITRVVALLTVAMLAAGACGSSESGVSVRGANESSDTTIAGGTSPTTSPPETVDTPLPTGPATTEPATTEPATTAPPPATTTAPSTTVPTMPRGWKREATFPVGVFPPFSEENWTGVPSPAFVTPLADGIYQASVATPWSPTNPTSLDIVLRPLVACADLPEGTCVDFGSPFGPNEIGVGEDPHPLTVTLDASIAIGLTGFDCEPVDARGNGTDLAVLFKAFDTAYSSTILPVLNSGTDVVGALNATPTNGFSGQQPPCGPTGFDLVFHAGDAPPLLLQVIENTQYDSNGYVSGTSPLTVTDEIRLNTVEVRNGLMTLYFYAGFYS